MKLFEKLKSCWGGAIVIPAVEESGKSASSRTAQHMKVGRGGCSRATAAISRNWKPKLNNISEDSVAFDFESDSNLSGKVKAKSKAKDRSPAHGEDYWKSSSMLVLPAYYSAPF